MTAIPTITLDAPAIRINQRTSEDEKFQKESDFFIFSLPSDTLLKIAKFLARTESKLGIQRAHKEERDIQIGRFITSDHPFFPNTIIINIPLAYDDSYYQNNRLKVDIKAQTAYIIDGQHRLKAFQSKYSNKTVLNLVVAAYFDLELPTIAEIFTRINYFQKPVNKSIVYDLLDFNHDPDFKIYTEAHSIAITLNTKVKSPFYNVIKILGVGDGLLSQASFVEALSTKYKIMSLLGKFSKDDKIDIIEKYFTSIKNAFPLKWASDNSILTRTIGFNALVKLLSYILKREPAIENIDFKKYTTAIKTIDVDAPAIKTMGGFQGVNVLAHLFIEKANKVAIK